jgi:hypothetical protein
MYLTIMTVAEVRALSGQDLSVLETSDYSGGLWIYDPSDTLSNDNTGAVLVTADGKRYKRQFDYLTPAMFGAALDGVADDSGILQVAIDYLTSIGGGKLVLPAAKIFLQYPVFVTYNMEVIGQGIATHIISERDVHSGRVAFVVGNAHEWNRQTVDASRALNHPTSVTTNPTYPDIACNGVTWLLPDGSTHAIEAQNSHIKNLLIEFVYTADSWGGYGIQFAHAYNCTADNIWSINACQAIGIGSDTPPSTPGCNSVFCTNIHVISPDAVHTFYAVGFIANSLNCSISGFSSPTPLTAGSPDGTLAAINECEDCNISNGSGTVGPSSTSEGILINNAKSCYASNILVRDAVKAYVTYFTETMFIDSTKRNSFSNCVAYDSGIIMMVLGKYTDFNNIKGYNYTTAINFDSINATNNVFTECTNDIVLSPVDLTNPPPSWPYTFNSLGQIKYTQNVMTKYINPSELVKGYNNNAVSLVNENLVQLNGSADFICYLNLSERNDYSFVGQTFYALFNAGSQTKNSSIVLSLLRYLDFSGNTTATLMIVGTITATPSGDALQDIQLNLDTLIAEQQKGITQNLVLKIEFTNPVAGSNIKRFSYQIYN